MFLKFPYLGRSWYYIFSTTPAFSNGAFFSSLDSPTLHTVFHRTSRSFGSLSRSFAPKLDACIITILSPSQYKTNPNPRPNQSNPTDLSNKDLYILKQKSLQYDIDYCTRSAARRSSGSSDRSRETGRQGGDDYQRRPQCDCDLHRAPRVRDDHTFGWNQR